MSDLHDLWGFGVFFVLFVGVLCVGGWWANRELERARRAMRLPEPDARVHRAGSIVEFKRRAS